MALVSGPVLAKALNITARRVQQLVSDDGMPRAERGKYDLGVCVSWYIRYLQSIVEKRSTSPDGTREAIAHAELEKAQADAEMSRYRSGQMRGHLAADEDAEAEVRRFCERVRGGVLSLRSRHQAELVGLKSIPEAGLALDRIAAALLTDLQRDAGGAYDTADLVDKPKNGAAA